MRNMELYPKVTESCNGKSYHLSPKRQTCTVASKWLQLEKIKTKYHEIYKFIKVKKLTETKEPIKFKQEIVDPLENFIDLGGYLENKK